MTFVAVGDGQTGQTDNADGRGRGSSRAADACAPARGPSVHVPSGVTKGDDSTRVSAGQAWTSGAGSPRAAWARVRALGGPSKGGGVVAFLGWLFPLAGRVIAAAVTTACTLLTWLVQLPGGVVVVGFLAAVGFLAWGVQ